MPEKEPQITVIGGGTGSFALLSELKHHTNNLNAVINMADDGGSTGGLRDELGVLPPGDVRQALTALSNDSEDLREQFNYRFESGKLEGHSWGNLFLSGIEARTGSFSEAVRVASELLNIQGRVIPSTLDNVQLVASVDGQTIVGESKVGDVEFTKGANPVMSLEPPAAINPEAKDALQTSDLIVIAPGNLYQSLAPNLVVQGMGRVLAEAQAPVAYVGNLVNKPLHTAEFAIHDYASEIERFAGCTVLDYVLYNTDEPTPELLERYALDGEHPVRVDRQALDDAAYEAIGGNFLSYSHGEQNKNDALKRSFIRHDGASIAAKLIELANKE